jgi:hypothetical protein
MKRWIDKIIGSTEDFPCVHEEERGALSLQVREYKRKCGHFGYLVEIFLRIGEDEERAQVGCFGWEDLQISVELIQKASDAIAARTGVRPLHTVRLWNKTFFVDEKLRVLRNVDDPHESVELTT